MIQTQLAALNTLSREELVILWQECFKVPAPNLSRSTFLRQAIAWHIQIQALGGLSLVEKRQIQSGQTKPITQAATGSRLIRVWQGKTHQV